MTTNPTKHSNLDKLRRLLSRPKGATLNTICKATEWQPHSARSAISRLRKSGLHIECAYTSNRSVISYRIVPVGGSAGAGK